MNNRPNWYPDIDHELMKLCRVVLILLSGIGIFVGAVVLLVQIEERYPDWTIPTIIVWIVLCGITIRYNIRRMRPPADEGKCDR